MDFSPFYKRLKMTKIPKFPNSPKIQSKTKIPLAKKTYIIIYTKILSSKQPQLKKISPIVTKVTAFHLLFSQICEFLLIIGRKFAQISQIFAQFSQKCEIFTRPKPHFTTT